MSTSINSWCPKKSPVSGPAPIAARYGPALLDPRLPNHRPRADAVINALLMDDLPLFVWGPTVIGMGDRIQKYAAIDR